VPVGVAFAVEAAGAAGVAFAFAAVWGGDSGAHADSTNQPAVIATRALRFMAPQRIRTP
jgi:hypothetical protein